MKLLQTGQAARKCNPICPEKLKVLQLRKLLISRMVASVIVLPIRVRLLRCGRPVLLPGWLSCWTCSAMSSMLNLTSCFGNSARDKGGRHPAKTSSVICVSCCNC